MKIETLLWSLPLLFILHDLEEIIMFAPWLSQAKPILQVRFPSLSKRMLPHFQHLTTSSFALAVLEEFILLLVLTVLAVFGQHYLPWLALLVGFLVHLVMHIFQFFIFRRYIFGIITTLAALPFSIYVLLEFQTLTQISWNTITLAGLFGVPVVAINLFLAHKLASRFQRWLDRHPLN